MPATAHMFIINPLTGRGVDNWFSTHPNTENRIAELEALAQEMGARPPRSPERPAPGAAALAVAPVPAGPGADPGARAEGRQVGAAGRRPDRAPARRPETAACILRAARVAARESSQWHPHLGAAGRHTLEDATDAATSTAARGPRPRAAPARRRDRAAPAGRARGRPRHLPRPTAAGAPGAAVADPARRGRAAPRARHAAAAPRSRSPSNRSAATRARGASTGSRTPCCAGWPRPVPGSSRPRRAPLHIPDWLWSGWRQAYGEATACRIAAASLVEAPLDVSVKSEPAVWAERLGGVVLPTGSVRCWPAAASQTCPATRRSVVGAGRRRGAAAPVSAKSASRWPICAPHPAARRRCWPRPARASRRSTSRPNGSTGCART